MGMREDIRIPLTMLSINFLNKLKYKGSYKGKRFMFEKNFEKDDAGKCIESTVKLRVYIWNDLFNFENTDKKDMVIKDFEYNDKGVSDGLNFVEETNI